MATEIKEIKKYDDIADTAIRLIKEIGKPESEEDSIQIALLYSLYYNSLAGALRNGAMYKKEMGTDGYTSFGVSVGTKVMSCRENVLRDVLREDFDRITMYPYEDTSVNFTEPYLTKNIINVSETVDTSAMTEEQVKALKLEEEEKKKAEKAATEERAKQLQEKAKKFKYDPNYDHYYDDELPVLLKELHSRTGVLVARILVAVLCVTASVLCFSLL